MGVNVEVIEKVTYQGREYVKSSEPAVEGDLVRMHEPLDGITVGAFYEVDEVDAFGDPQIVDDEGDDFDTDGCGFDVFKPVEQAAKAPAEGGPYREVNRRARVGERIKIVSPFISLGKYKKGDILTVTDDDDLGLGCGVATKEVGGGIAHSEYVVLEPTKSAAETTFAAGDKVRLISGGGEVPLSGFENGAIYTVENPTFQHDGIDRISLRKKGAPFATGFALPEQLEKVSDAPAESKFKAGDYARVNDDTFGDTGVIVRVEKKWSDEERYDVEVIVGKSSRQSADVKNLEKVTDAEVEAARKEIAEAAKWAAIGRKPGEYKAGDIVDCVGLAKGKTGYGEVIDVLTPFKRYKVKYSSTTYGTCGEGVELITLVCPVEQRFDRDGGGDA